MPIVDVQRRMMELGRIRLGGEKGDKKPGAKLSNFRLTSASKALLEAASKIYGGEVATWDAAPNEGVWQLFTESPELDVLVPPVLSMQNGEPTMPYSQFYEHYVGGGCQRRCDGETLVGGAELGSKPSAACLCNADERLCKITTRVNVMLPRLPGIGVWRVESHGWNAAVELPGTLELLRLAAEGSRFIPAVLRIEHRTDKQPGQPIKRYIVPVLDTPETTVGELLASVNAPRMINAPSPRPPRPALTAGTSPPEETAFDADETAAWGKAPDVGVTVDEKEPAETSLIKLTFTLLELSETLGKKPDTEKAIRRNLSSHKDEPWKHEAWLEKCIEKAKADLAEGVPVGGESDFARMAQEAQAAKAGT